MTALGLADSAYFENLKADVLYVYEHGLWSGVEIVFHLCRRIPISSFLASWTKVTHPSALRSTPMFNRMCLALLGSGGVGGDDARQVCSDIGEQLRGSSSFQNQL